MASCASRGAHGTGWCRNCLPQAMTQRPVRRSGAWWASSARGTYGWRSSAPPPAGRRRWPAPWRRWPITWAPPWWPPATCTPTTPGGHSCRTPWWPCATGSPSMHRRPSAGETGRRCFARPTRWRAAWPITPRRYGDRCCWPSASPSTSPVIWATGFPTSWPGIPARPPIRPLPATAAAPCSTATPSTAGAMRPSRDWMRNSGSSGTTACRGSSCCTATSSRSPARWRSRCAPPGRRGGRCPPGAGAGRPSARSCVTSPASRTSTPSTAASSSAGSSTRTCDRCPTSTSTSRATCVHGSSRRSSGATATSTRRWWGPSPPSAPAWPSANWAPRWPCPRPTSSGWPGCRTAGRPPMRWRTRYAACRAGMNA